MGSKGGGGATSTSYTSSLPEYAEPYYHDLMASAEAVSQEPYIPYQGDRIAQFSQDQLASQGGTRDLYNYGNPALQGAQNYASYATADALGRSYDPNAVGVNYNPYAYDPGAFSTMMMDPNGQDVNTAIFNSDVRDYYMSPYTDHLKDMAQLDHERQAVMRNQDAVAAGAFGGDRRFIGDYLAEEGLLNRKSGIEAEAFENAQMQFERDRAARLQADLANQGYALQSGMANQGQWLEAQRLGEQSRQFGAGLYDQGSQFGADMDFRTQALNEANRLAAEEFGLQADQLGITGAATLGDLGTADQSAWLSRLQALSGSGAEQQSLGQSALDYAYQDFLNQRDYPRNTLSWLAGIMGGVPVSPSSETVTTQPAPNPISQLSGLGLAGLSLYNSGMFG